MIKGADASPRSPPPTRPGDAPGARPAVRFCRDCRHARPAYDFVGITLGLSRKAWRQSAEFASCAHFSAVLEHTDERVRDWIVTGQPSARPATSLSLCATQRGFAGGGRCGPEARFWEPRAPGESTWWRDPTTRRPLLRAFLRSWGWYLASISAGLVGGALLSWGMMP